MRVSSYFLIVALLIFSFSTAADAQAITPHTFSQNLSLGSSGADVTALQDLLNQDPATRIAATGPGSPGNETDYFGSLTQAAVIRFQDKYASAVLTPVGLASGNGYVGPYTRAQLNALATAPAPATATTVRPPVTPATATTTPIQTLPVTPVATTTASQNPNLKNIDIILADIDKVGAAQGLSAAALAKVKESIMTRLATTTDLRAAFLKTVANASPRQAIGDGTFFGRVLATISRAFDSVFMPERAFASAGLPFGGALLGVVPCDVGFNLIVEPLPPTYATVLYYVEGTQVYLSYNIPATSNLLGTYIPGGGGCVIGFVYIPSEGTITPMVGSAPL